MVKYNHGRSVPEVGLTLASSNDPIQRFFCSDQIKVTYRRQARGRPQGSIAVLTELKGLDENDPEPNNSFLQTVRTPGVISPGVFAS